MRTNFDLSPYRRSTVGFDRLFEWLESATRVETADSYPPFNVERQADNQYRITLAVAGFTSDEVDINLRDGVLIVAGRKADDRDGDRQFLYRGIGTRAFERRFELADFVQVRGADLKDGLLTIDLVREVPEAMKPRKIEIGGSARPLDEAPGDQQPAGGPSADGRQAA